jgi:ABC-type uncharacterized transport system permease subunit
MDRKFGTYVFFGLLIGAIFGSALGAANGNSVVGLGIGALTGVFLSWFIAVAVNEKEKGKKG